MVQNSLGRKTGSGAGELQKLYPAETVAAPQATRGLQENGEGAAPALESVEVGVRGESGKDPLSLRGFSFLGQTSHLHLAFACFLTYSRQFLNVGTFTPSYR